MTENKSRYVLVVTGCGRWYWWPLLQVVEFVPKGKRAPNKEEYLTSFEEKEAYEKIFKRELKDLKRKVPTNAV